ncbi:MAG TPA: hypothetical protein VFV58_24365, partial [Blastocatellia bacterium]|nr:hypothetical protein [Blastocatellia bacterium]
MKICWRHRVLAGSTQLQDLPARTRWRHFLRSLHVALRRPETMKRESAMRFRMCGKMGQDERWSEVVSYLSFNS